MSKIFKVDRETLFFAFRYALGRMTYAPYTITENIKANIDNVSTGDIKLYIKEIKECSNYGMKFDEKYWLEFVAFLEEELNKRERLED